MAGAGINPARDLGPRIFCAMVYGSDMFTAANGFVWIDIMGPLFGALGGTTLYRLIVNPA